jgi:hypothetical protein
LLYLAAPALAVLVKYEVLSHGLVGLPFDQLPQWIGAGPSSTPSLVSVQDINLDGILQLGELHLGGDIIVLAAPEIGGLPYCGDLPGGRRRPGGGAVHGRRPAADDRQCAVARHLLPDAGPACARHAPRHDRPRCW